VTSISKNIATLLTRIRRCEAENQREPGSVELLAVSKKHGVDKIIEAYEAGQRHFGENYLQEAEAKIAELGELEIVWHFIGPIQSNKTRGIANQFDWVHSVDRLKIARRLSEQRSPELSELNLCVQVNVSQEDSKSGAAMEELASLCGAINELPNIRLRGLMAIPEATTDIARQHAVFHELAEKFTELRHGLPHMDTLSMGMTDDYPAAIAEGATFIRIGTAIFGKRTD